MKKRFLGVIIALVFVALITNGCYYDNEETLYPQGACDTLVVKYSDQITGILSTKCYECHNNANFAIAGGGFCWEGYANISGYLAGGGTTTFIDAINHNNSTPMPKDRPKLSECDIRTIEIWIENGFPNN